MQTPNKQQREAKVPELLDKKKKKVDKNALKASIDKKQKQYDNNEIIEK
jgi:hypothetical protein